MDWQSSVALLERVPTLAAGDRSAAIEGLARSASPWVRQRALEMGATVLPDERLVELMRDEADDIGRNMGLEMLKLRGARAFALAVSLLADDDPDVVLQAVLVLDAQRAPRAIEPLRGGLHHDDPNVVQAAIVALGHVGDARVLADLVPFLSADPWLRVAALQALGDLRSPKALPHLGRLLEDAELGSFVAEAMARIGGRPALVALGRHWLQHRDGTDPEAMLGLLAHVAEGIESEFPDLPGLADAARLHLGGPGSTGRAAARLLLCLGQGRETDEALAVLEACEELPRELPPSLGRRRDLLPRLLTGPSPLFRWGLALALRHPGQLDARDVEAAVRSPHAADELESLVKLLGRCRVMPARALLDLHGRLPPAGRTALVPALLRHREATLEVLSASTIEPGPRGVVLRALLAPEKAEVREALAELPPEWLCEAVDHLQHLPDLLRVIPWRALLARDPHAHGEAVARAAMVAGLRELRPDLRAALAVAPEPAIIRALAELRDAESVPMLERLLGAPGDLPRVLALDALGLIGGDASRRALRRALATLAPAERGLGYRALARCCTAADAELFRRAATDGDWLVRLAAADTLGRFPGAENLGCLMSLSSDPVVVVAQRACSALES